MFAPHLVCIYERYLSSASTDNCGVACPDVFLHRMFDQPVVSGLAATHLATRARETYYYKVGVTSLCQSQSAGLAFLNSCGCQLLAISAPTEPGLSCHYRLGRQRDDRTHSPIPDFIIKSQTVPNKQGSDLETTRNGALT